MKENLPTQLVNCSLDVTQITVGGKVQLACPVPRLEKKDFKVLARFSDLNAKPEDFIFMPLGDVEVKGADVIQTFTSYRVGDHDLSRLKLIYKDEEFLVSPQKIKVVTVLPKTEQGQPEPTPYPITDAIKVWAPWWWWTAWGLLLATVLFFIIRETRKYLKKRKALKAEVAKTPLTPHEKYSQNLRRLESQGFHLKGDYKAFAVGITIIVKKAMGEELKFAAEDLTTEELVLVLKKNHRGFWVKAENLLEIFLSDLDQIKFAKTEVTVDRCVDLLDQASRIGRMLYGGSQ